MRKSHKLIFSFLFSFLFSFFSTASVHGRKGRDEVNDRVVEHLGMIQRLHNIGRIYEIRSLFENLGNEVLRDSTKRNRDGRRQGSGVSTRDGLIIGGGLGASIGSIWGVRGTLIGAGAGSLGGLIWAKKSQKKARTNQEEEGDGGEGASAIVLQRRPPEFSIVNRSGYNVQPVYISEDGGQTVKAVEVFTDYITGQVVLRDTGVLPNNGRNQHIVEPPPGMKFGGVVIVVHDGQVVQLVGHTEDFDRGVIVMAPDPIKEDE